MDIFGRRSPLVVDEKILMHWFSSSKTYINEETKKVTKKVSDMESGVIKSIDKKVSDLNKKVSDLDKKVNDLDKRIGGKT